MNKEKQIAQDFIKDQFSKQMKLCLDVTSEKNKELLIDYVLKSKAWNDTIIYERTKKGSKVLKKCADASATLKNEIGKLCENSNYQLWHERMLKKLSEDYFESKYGMAQKFLNMSMKYFYLIEFGYGIELFDNLSLCQFKDDFDVPIDSFILKWLIYNSVGDQEFRDKAQDISSWNKMTCEIYPFLQTKTKNLLKKRYEDLDSILIAETAVWDGIKDLKAKIKMEI